MDSAMFDSPVVFVDIETTGGSHTNSRVLEVAAIRVENNVVTKEFSTLIDPQTYIPQFITNITGITEADVAGAPTFDQIAPELLELCDGAIFIAHNVRFDYSFLKHEFANAGYSFRPKLLCTVRLSRALYAQHKGHSLEAIINRHNIPFEQRHRALDDTRAIWYFTKMAFQEHGPDLFSAAVAKQLKSQYVPANLTPEMLKDIPNTPGVYIFEDEAHRPIYVGKSIHIRERVLSHLQDTSPKEVKISQQIHHVKTIQTAHELAALLLESKLVKQLQPIFNRKLRRVSSYAVLIRENDADGYASLKVVSKPLTQEDDLDAVYGLYESPSKAKKHLDLLTRTFGLCPKLMSLEKTKRACFAHSLGKCSGACIGKEDPASYNERFEIAAGRSRLENWPYDGPLELPVGDNGMVVIDKWMVQSFIDEQGAVEAHESEFNIDEYRIIRGFLKELGIRPLSPGNTA